MEDVKIRDVRRSVRMVVSKSDTFALFGWGSVELFLEELKSRCL
jgi:hypothetical protein